MIEGFYGAPWAPDARLDVIRRIAAAGMNAYVYAPKDDPKHRKEWRAPYTDDELGHFDAVVATCREHGVRFGFAISPGLDIDYAVVADRDALLGKLRALAARGVEWFVLALDDIPERSGLARAQCELTGWLGEQIAPASLTLVPTQYVGGVRTEYLDELGRDLPGAVDLMWTGPTVCSPAVTAADADAWLAAVHGRRTLLWDNFPVNDGGMADAVHLGPYTGRDPALATRLAGVLCDPMTQAHASLVPLLGAAEFLGAPERVEPLDAWEHAIDVVGGPHAEALRAVARTCADSALYGPRNLELHVLIDDYERHAGDLAGIRACGERSRAAAEALVKVEPFATELAPWLVQISRETLVLRFTCDVLDALESPAGPSTEQVMGMVALRIDSAQQRTIVFGPRMKMYPQATIRPDGRPGVDPSFYVEAANAIDRLVHIALTRWRASQAESPGRSS